MLSCRVSHLMQALIEVEQLSRQAFLRDSAACCCGDARKGGVEARGFNHTWYYPMPAKAQVRSSQRVSWPSILKSCRASPVLPGV